MIQTKSTYAGVAHVGAVEGNCVGDEDNVGASVDGALEGKVVGFDWLGDMVGVLVEGNAVGDCVGKETMGDNVGVLLVGSEVGAELGASLIVKQRNGALNRSIKVAYDVS